MTGREPVGDVTRPAARAAEWVVLAAFAGFGVTWGMYAAAIPAIRAATGVSDGFLGAALSCVGLTALPAMLFAGRLIDRAGRPAFVAALALFAVTAPLPMVVTSGPALVLTLLVFGGCSGAFDVAINHAAVAAEAATGRRVLNRAHAVFSLGLLSGSLILGASRSAGLTPRWPLAALGLVLLAGAAPAWAGLAGTHAAPEPGAAAGGRGVWTGGLVWVAGALGVLALLVESGLQQWSAVFLEDVLKTAPAISSLGPAVFAGAAAAGRMSGHFLGRTVGDVTLLVCAGLAAAPGAVLLATAGSPAVALAGLFLAGMGISVGSPTLYGFAGRRVPASMRGRMVAAVSGIAYVGLLGGPGLVGQLADLSGLRWAFGVLAVIALVLGAGSLTLRRWSLTPAGGR
ncbi:MFS transporter [Actinomadura sp. DC4]|uniref:MFS transporter n=1 Tax=Actinomadura sp. DC4 TaxID=3055069 RepID=UPI0025B241CE|nr:MFS transporter [Actinomadura sp. DC4]MDN3359418.1 MFS transporter [Actinomadura sp. DC4]